MPESARTAVGFLISSGLVIAVALGRPWPAAVPAVAQGSDPVLTPELTRVLAGSTGERVPVVIELARQRAPAPIAFDRDLRAVEEASTLADLYGRSAERLRGRAAPDLSLDLFAGKVLWIGGAVAAELTPAQVRALENMSGVRRVHYDGLLEVRLRAPSAPLVWRPGPAFQDPTGGLPWGLEAIGAPGLWAAGATGAGSVVAIIDSGVDGDHPLLRRKWRGLDTSPAEAWFDPWGVTDRPVDDNRTGGVGHGTIVATIAVGSLEPGDTLVELGDRLRVVQDPLEVVTGVAPGAGWVAANAFEEFGGSSFTRRSILLQALQWVLDPDGDPATRSDVPDAVNNSWGFPPGGCDGVFDRAIDALERVGVPVVFAAGNRSAGFDTVASPANRADLLLNSFAVGAADQGSDDEIFVADNSLGGPSPCAPGAVKPEVVAPGNVPLVRGETGTRARVGGLSGAFTSWAAPHATGALALLRGLNGSAGSDELKGALFATARDLPPAGLDNRSGAGFIDLAAATDRIGGVAGARLELAGWSVESDALELRLFNRGRDPFPGGAAELLERPGGGLLARTAAPAIAPGRQGAVRFAGAHLDPGAGLILTLRLISEGATLELPVRLADPPQVVVQLESGDVRFALDAHGRLGRVAGPDGFRFLERDWLTAGGFLFGRADRVSDAVYVDVQARPTLKSDPVGSDTDWRGGVADRASDRATLSFDDSRALNPLGVSVEQRVELVALGDSAAFISLVAQPRFGAGPGIPLAGVMLDWDLGRDSVFWDDGLGASVMTAADSSGPWMALTTAAPPPGTHAAVALGTPEGGFFALGSGALSGLFTDRDKGRLLRLGGDQASRAGVTDWAQMVGTGPLRPNDPVEFVIAAGRSRAALAEALASARARSAAGPPSDTGRRGDRLEILPAYPNPFDPARGQVVRLPFLVSRETRPLEAAVEIFTISGQRVFTERRQIPAAAPLQPFEWDGRLADGEFAASGVYGYVIRADERERTGKFLLLK